MVFIIIFNWENYYPFLGLNLPIDVGRHKNCLTLN